MTPKFAQAIDPIFEYVLNLLDRIDRGDPDDPLAAEEEKHRIVGLLEKAQAKGGIAAAEWQSAKYALVCWIDEMLIAAPWEGSDWWGESSLELSLFSQMLRATNFFEQAKKTKDNQQRDALEVYYLAVILGFRGLYDNLETAEAEASRLDLPVELPEWVQQTEQAIRHRPVPPLPTTRQDGSGAPPLGGQGMLILSFVAVAILAAVTLITAYWKYISASRTSLR